MKKLIYSSLTAVLLLAFCAKNVEAQQNEDDKIYSFTAVESAPTYPGGLSNFYKFLGENIKYPADAVKENVQGNVFVSFTVEKDGSLNDIKVDRKLGAGTDEEAVRVLKLSEKWNPGTRNGKAVRVKYNIPVKFSIPGKKPNPKVAVPMVIPGVDNRGENAIYNFVSLENPPQFIGGISKFYEFLGSNIKYPQLAKENKIEGIVFVSFVVEKDGTLNNIKVDRSLGSGTDEEAVRVIKLSPAWQPGMVGEKPVRVKYNIPVRFSLNSKK